MSGSSAYSCIDPAQNERFGIYGISERKERDDHISKMGKHEIRIPKPRILVQGILCGYGREECESDMDTVGKNAKAIKEYIATQQKKDKEMSQMSIDDLDDPFTGSK